MWAMKDFVSDNAPPKNMEQQIVAALDKERDQRGGRLKLVKQKFRKLNLRRSLLMMRQKLCATNQLRLKMNSCGL